MVNIKRFKGFYSKFTSGPYEFQQKTVHSITEPPPTCTTPWWQAESYGCSSTEKLDHLPERAGIAISSIRQHGTSLLQSNDDVLMSKWSVENKVKEGVSNGTIVGQWLENSREYHLHYTMRCVMGWVSLAKTGMKSDAIFLIIGLPNLLATDACICELSKCYQHF